MMATLLGRPGAALKGLPARRNVKCVNGQSSGILRGSSKLPMRVQRCQRKRRNIQMEASATAAVDVLAAAVPSNVNPLLVGTTAYSCGLLVLMLAAPFSIKLRQFFRSTAMFLPLAVAYLILLVQAWTPDTWSLILPGNLEAGFQQGFNPQFFPKLSGIMHLFSQPVTIASFWVHILTVNLVFARSCLVHGLNNQVPTWHTVLLSAVFGPLGVLSHIITCAMVSFYRMATGQAASGLQRPTVLKNSGGTITILPY